MTQAEEFAKKFARDKNQSSYGVSRHHFKLYAIGTHFALNHEGAGIVMVFFKDGSRWILTQANFAKFRGW